MAVAVTIDFNNTYEIEPVSDDLRVSKFNTELADGEEIPLQVEISSEAHELITARITKKQFIRPDFMYNYFIFKLREQA